MPEKPLNRAAVADVPKTMLKRISALIHNPERTYTVSYEKVRQPAQELAPKVCHTKDIDRVTDGISDFILAMLRLPNVQALAFLGAQQPRVPITLSLQVIAPLPWGNETSKAATTAIYAADDALAKQIRRIVPRELQLIDSSGSDLDSLLQDLHHQWSDSKDCSILGIIRFRRDVSECAPARGPRESAAKPHTTPYTKAPAKDYGF